MTHAASPARLDELQPLTEAEFQRNVVDMAHTCGWLCVHFGSGMNRRGQHRTPAYYDAAGFVDLLLIDREHGHVLFRELKSDRGRLTDRQRMWQELLTEANCDVAVWRPKDWPDIVAFLSHGKARIA